jgi:hypothetical protein
MRRLGRTNIRGLFRADCGQSVASGLKAVSGHTAEVSDLRNRLDQTSIFAALLVHLSYVTCQDFCLIKLIVPSESGDLANCLVATVFGSGRDNLCPAELGRQIAQLDASFLLCGDPSYKEKTK